MSKMGLHNPFGHLKHKLGPKERSGVKLAIWFRPLKIGNRPDFLGFRWCATYRWKAFNKCYNFTWDLISIGGLHAKLWAPKVAGVIVVGILRLPLRSLETKWYLGASPMARHKVYYKGEGGGFPHVWAVVSFVSPSLLVAHPNTKSAPTMH
jgi:hypothetical protein